eukprot:TRINITY_DN53330_c0_g1_i1.p1 TRINITY_DN53330_c0_g1~~TRINITY_DN53330_c0_g1_i1.p1  ORF type:complete len:303 (-),score=40.55 TRINITY_DN53330_c0_g1_i1:181-987(-)
MSTKENVVFTAAMDEELLILMEQEVFKGRRGVRGAFKDEAYIAVATTMTETSHGAYVLTAESIRNRSEYLKKDFDAVTEPLKASGFRFNRATKQVVASEEAWGNWLEGHPDAGPWKSKTVNYEQLSLVFDINVTTGQYSRSSSALVTQHNPVSGSRCNTLQLASSRKKRSRKSDEELYQIAAYVKKSTNSIRSALEDLAESIRNPKRRMADDVVRELMQIPDLSPTDMDLTHEWLIVHWDMATVFLTTPDKQVWIQRQLHRIREDLFP